MYIRNIKELCSIVDLLLTVLHKGDFIEIGLKFSGIINREGSEFIERIHVTDAVSKISADYSESGIAVSSTTSKSVVKWLGDTKPGNHVRANSYLSFIEELDCADISSIIYNGDELITSLENNEGLINIANLMEFVTDRSSNTEIKVVLSTGTKQMSMLYSDNVFSRLVKLNNKYTLYVNTGQAMNRILKKYHLFAFTVCAGVPSITTRIDLYRNTATNSQCEFEIITANT